MRLRLPVSQAENRPGFASGLSRPSKLVLIGLNLVGYCLLLQWLLGSIQYDKLIDQVRQIPALAVLGSILINLTALVLYAIRMGVLLGRDFRVAFSVVCLGYALNTLIPLRLGEAIKIYLGHRLYAIPLLRLLSAFTAEKLVDLLKLLLLGLVVVAFAARQLIQASMLLPLVFLVLMGASGIVLFRLKIVWFVKLLPKGGRLRRTAIELHKHAKSYPIGRILYISAAIWILNVALVFFTFNAYLPELSIGIMDAVVLLLILALAISIPAAPAGIGIFEAGIVAYLTQKFGVANEAALAAAVVFHLVITVPQLAIAGWIILIKNASRGLREPV